MQCLFVTKKGRASTYPFRGKEIGDRHGREPLLHEISNELRNLIGGGIEREMPSIDDVHFGLRHVAAIGFRLRWIERKLILAPDHEQARLLLAHPRLPLWISIDIRAVVVEEVALNLGLARLVQKVKFIGPQ